MRVKSFLTRQSPNRLHGLLLRFLERFYDLTTFYGEEPVHPPRVYGEVQEIKWTPYLTKIRVWPGYYLHLFWRMDFDLDWHDHPWDFWTFPLYPKEGVRRGVPAHGG